MTCHQRLYVRALFILFIASNASALAEAPTSEPSEDDKPVATVQTARMRRGEIEKAISVYGSVVPAPGAILSISSPIEDRVVHVRTSAGQAVKKGDLLLELEPSPDTKLQLLDARNGLEAAKKNLADLQQRFDLKLATNADLLQMQQAAKAAELKLDELQKRGAAEEVRKVTAAADALVSKIDVQEGQVVAAGGPMIELLVEGKVEVSVGVEPAESRALAVGQMVQLFASAGAGVGFGGKIRLISGQINAGSRLVDVFITSDVKASLLLDDFVRGEMKVHSARAMIVPVSAILADDDGFSIFITKDSKAVKKKIKVITQNEKEAAIGGEDLSDGDSVVIAGSLELEDGMDVSVEGAK